MLLFFDYLRGNRRTTHNGDVCTIFIFWHTIYNICLLFVDYYTLPLQLRRRMPVLRDFTLRRKNTENFFKKIFQKLLTSPFFYDIIIKHSEIQR